jgi:AAA15 family ATPase/GTPase
VVRSLRRDDAEGVLRAIVSDSRAFQVLDDGDGKTALYIEYSDRAVPVGMAGDGVQSAVQVLLELARLPEGGLGLVEEPEAFQHPSALRSTAAVLVATARRGVQVVLTTHSLELIDDLIDEAGGDLELVVVFNLALIDGELRSSRVAGEQARSARQDTEIDLR